MNARDAAKILKEFQCDYNRSLEENFAQTFAEDELVRLFFINENQAFTDGRNIVVDPAAANLYYDTQALKKTSEYLGWPGYILADTWNALRIITRAQTIHECLHLLYTEIPSAAVRDPRCNTRIRRKVMASIGNIIEDAYIEAVGSSVYDNTAFYLEFGRVSRLFLSHEDEGTMQRNFSEMKEDSDDETGKKISTLISYLDYMVGFLLYPMLDQGDPGAEIASYVEATKPLFLKGSMAPSPSLRYDYTGQVFTVIEPLIPDLADEEEKKAVTAIDRETERMLGGTKTHSTSSGSLLSSSRTGKEQAVSRRLFDSDDREKNLAQLHQAVEQFAADKNGMKIVGRPDQVFVRKGTEYDCAVIHKNIQIKEKHPKIDFAMRRAYQNIFDRYQLNIRSYASRLVQILKARVTEREENYAFGNGITSSRLGDPHRHYWYRNVEGIDVPDMAVLLLVDGSGSMYGERIESAMKSSVILHEVLSRTGIEHAIVEHRAPHDEAAIEANVLVDFHGRPEEKYNLMHISADEENRDALALFWAERYLIQKSQAERKLIIVLSDGLPSHGYDDYYDPVSTKDTANAVLKITRRGTDIIAVALDDSDDGDTYGDLKEIYPNMVDCVDLEKLTGQILNIIARLL